MEKSRLLMALVVIMAMTMAPKGRGIPTQSPEAAKKWFRKLPRAQEMLTDLHFYFQDTVSGNNPTATKVAQSNITPKSQTFFGMVSVLDDPLTTGPEPDSKIVGYAHGIYDFASKEEVCLLMALRFVFTEGKYNARTLSVLGHNRLFLEYRELPIVGRSGVFRLARGIATAKTYKLDISTGDAVVDKIKNYDIY